MSKWPLNPITYIGQTNFRNQKRNFGIKRADRRSHIYIIGKTGTGKSTLLKNLIIQDMKNGEGLALLDPHGDLVEGVLTQVPKHRKNDLIYFNVTDQNQPLGFNPLENVPYHKRALAASGLLEVFKKIWHDSWGPRTEHILRNAILTLYDQPWAALGDVLRLLDDPVYRQNAITQITNPIVRNFWLREYEKYSVRFRNEAIAPIQNKIGAFLSNPLLYRILNKTKSDFDLRKIMDEGRILLVNLSKGKIGEDTASLLGALLVTSIGLAAFSRADVQEEKRRDFYLFLDEFQNFTTLSLANMLSEIRKQRVSVTLAHQYLSQLDNQIRDAILGNVGTIISFRLGLNDAELLEKEFYPVFSAGNLVRLPNHHIYLKLMVNGVVSEPFSGEPLKPRS